jgi:nicotinate phosphoribosyltransferase
MRDLTSPLLTDLYQLNMIQAYLDRGDTKTAVFEFFVRKLPARQRFLIAAGLEQALDFLEGLRRCRKGRRSSPTNRSCE